MIPPPFEYLAPRSLPEAMSLLQQHGADAKLLAGGQSLIPLLKFRLASPSYLIDLQHVPGLDTLAERDGALVIGAMVRETAVEHSSLIQQHFTGLREASEVVADPVVRNFATLGGNLAHADPANDHPAMLLAMRAQIVTQGPKGQRHIPIDDFLVDTFETALTPDEILIEIHVPRPTNHSGSAYAKLERKVGDYAIAAVGAQVSLHNGVCMHAGIGLTNVGPKAIRATQAEQFLVGKPLDDQTIREAARLAAAAAEPTSDLRGPADYKRAVVRTLTARALHQAAERAQKGA
ncbi:MAG TPA: xanthine dehydrogenase family protein subunit M [Ktedonobacterales bacterium]